MPGPGFERGDAGRFSAGAGAKGPRYHDWAWIEIGADGHRHLLIRRNPSSGELAFYLCWSPQRMPLSELVRVAGSRWCIEECFQAAKSQVGLDHYQVRHWTAWHRHITLAMPALAFWPPSPPTRHRPGPHSRTGPPAASTPST
jgi:SRSO17 transposase